MDPLRASVNSFLGRGLRGLRRLELPHQLRQLQQRRRREQTEAGHLGRRGPIGPFLQNSKRAPLGRFQNERGLTAVASSFDHPEALSPPRVEGVGDHRPSPRFNGTMCSSH